MREVLVGWGGVGFLQRIRRRGTVNSAKIETENSATGKMGRMRRMLMTRRRYLDSVLKFREFRDAE